MDENKQQRLSSPVQYFGGKGRLSGRIIALMPAHAIYVEAYGGGGSVLLAKPKPAPVEVYNDLNGSVVNFFRVLRDTERFARFYHLAQHTPYSREVHGEALASLEQSADPVERAFNYWVTAQQSFSGVAESWGYSVTSVSDGQAQATKRWRSVILMLPAVHERLMRVQIEHDKALRVIERYDTDDTLHYLDPPYVAATRRSGAYACEMTDDDHRELVERLLGVRGMVLLSGYGNEMYEPLTRNGWARIDVNTHAWVSHNRASIEGNKKPGNTDRAKRVECIWVSPRVWAMLSAEGRLPKGDERTTIYAPSKAVRANVERAAAGTKKRG